MSRKLKEKVIICSELLRLCDILSIDILNKNNSLITLLEDRRFKSLCFINSDMLKNEREVNSPLRREDNKLISDFVYSLGKSDSQSQLKLISSFRESIKLSREKYQADYSKNSRLYPAFGAFAGIVFSLIVL